MWCLVVLMCCGTNVLFSGSNVLFMFSGSNVLFMFSGGLMCCVVGLMCCLVVD